jgi:hypothetical protein
MRCSGNAAQICGGSARLSVYNDTSYVVPVVVQSVAAFSVQSCFSDSVTQRSLANYSYALSTSMTVENCVTTCQGLGYSKAGLEYGSECYCGNKLASTSVQVSIGDCQGNFCSGNMKEFCGGPKRLLVYSL